MGRRIQTGFTVIEVVLVIAISGLIMLGIMGNSMRQVNEQNYREGVESFRDFLAGQFEDIDAVKNNQSGGCGGGSTAARGMGACFYSGKLIHIQRIGDGTKLVSYPVKSTVNEAANPPIISTVAAIKTADENIVSSEIQWGLQARLSGVNAGTPLENLYILVFRDPVDGTASSHIFKGTTGENSAQLLRMVKPGLSPESAVDMQTNDQIVCLSDPNSDVRDRWLALKISPGIVNASSLTMVGSGKCV